MNKIKNNLSNPEGFEGWLKAFLAHKAYKKTLVIVGEAGCGKSILLDALEEAFYSVTIRWHPEYVYQIAPKTRLARLYRLPLSKDAAGLQSYGKLNSIYETSVTPPEASHLEVCHLADLNLQGLARQEYIRAIVRELKDGATL